MAPRKKAAKKAAKKATKRTAKKSARKAAKKSARKTAKKTARKGAKKTARKAAKKGARKTAKKATKRASTKRATPTAAKAAPDAERPKKVKWGQRRDDVFTQLDLQDHLMAWNPQLSKKEVKTLVEDTLETLQTAIKKTGKVRLKGIGTITTKKIPAQRGGKLVKNPFTGEMVKSKPKPARLKVKMSPAKEIKEK